ncbi:hypothetical protein HMPREF9554_01251 [Treponema phagedenis F0421]|nr:hypothetical protein HMPREF9554_01251 [Treponema phagedenis F0421]
MLLVIAVLIITVCGFKHSYGTLPTLAPFQTMFKSINTVLLKLKL